MSEKQDMGQVLGMIDTATGALTASISIIAGSAPVVAGIGIMNTMLVSVKERTREIGVRKALGATQSPIPNQFLLETLALRGSGGLLGVVFAIAAIQAVAAILPLVKGPVFGHYPASRAAKMDPVEALRYDERRHQSSRTFSATLVVMLVACSTMPLRSLDAVASYAAAYRAAFAAKPLFELGYEWNVDSPSLAPNLRGAVLCVHAPCPRAAFFPNLGSRDPPVRRRSLEDIRASAETAAAFGAGFVVLHPGYTLDCAVPLDADRRHTTLARHAGAEARYIWSRGGSICAPGYCESTSYRSHRDVAVENLAEALQVCADEGIGLAVENLNPRVGYLFQLPAELVGLVHALPRLRICVDLGHLWIASLVHGFDYLRGLRDILATGRVASAHVHDNDSQLGRREVRGVVDAPPDGSRFVDDHRAIGRGLIPIAAAVHQLKRAGVGTLVVETRDPPLASVRRLIQMLGHASGGGG